VRDERRGSVVQIRARHWMRRVRGIDHRDAVVLLQRSVMVRSIVGAITAVRVLSFLLFFSFFHSVLYFGHAEHACKEILTNFTNEICARFAKHLKNKAECCTRNGMKPATCKVHVFVSAVARR